MSSDLSTQWATIRGALLNADSIAFDGCHKIYILMDPGQTKQMVMYGYREGGSQMRLRSEGATPEQMLEALYSWFDESCALRFISAVRTTADGDNFTDLISQFEEYDDEDNDDD